MNFEEYYGEVCLILREDYHYSREPNALEVRMDYEWATLPGSVPIVSFWNGKQKSNNRMKKIQVRRHQVVVGWLLVLDLDDPANYQVVHHKRDATPMEQEDAVYVVQMLKRREDLQIVNA